MRLAPSALLKKRRPVELGPEWFRKWRESEQTKDTGGWPITGLW